MSGGEQDEGVDTQAKFRREVKEAKGLSWFSGLNFFSFSVDTLRVEVRIQILEGQVLQGLCDGEHGEKRAVGEASKNQTNTPMWVCEGLRRSISIAESA